MSLMIVGVAPRPRMILNSLAMVGVALRPRMMQQRMCRDGVALRPRMILNLLAMDGVALRPRMMQQQMWKDGVALRPRRMQVLLSVLEAPRELKQEGASRREDPSDASRPTQIVPCCSVAKLLMMPTMVLPSPASMEAPNLWKTAKKERVVIESVSTFTLATRE